VSELARKKVSIVVPAYNEQESVGELARRLNEVFAANPAYDFEVIIVENGSADATWPRLQEIVAQDPRYRAVRLSRNFGCDGGLTAGMKYATGDAVVIMAADLQDPPEMITPFIKKWEEGYEIVYQIVTKRTGTNFLRRMNSEAFYWIINRLTDGMMPRNVSDFRLVDARVYRTINTMEERNRFLRGLFAWVGFKSIGLPCVRPERFAGTSKAYTLRVLALALKGIFAHSYVPLRVITVLGLAVSMLAFVLLIRTIVVAFAYGVPFDGYGTIIGIMLLMFGFLFTMLGVIGEYVGLIYEEVKQRPNFVVRDTIGFEAPSGG
jgi:glycosyltransferase involved in cell wall biosynthesis